MKVCCIMPTMGGREDFAVQAAKYFLNQNYADKELLVITEKNNWDILTEILPWSDIRIVATGCHTAKDKITYGLSYTKADLIIRWDDDDISFPHRIKQTVKEFRKSRKEVVGLKHAIFYEYATEKLFYCPPLSGSDGGEGYIHPSGAFYPHAWEDRHDCKPEKFAPLSDLSIMMIGMHVKNTVNKKPWAKHPLPQFKVNDECL